MWRHLTQCDEVRSKTVLRRDQYSSSLSNVREQAYSSSPGSATAGGLSRSGQSCVAEGTAAGDLAWHT